MPGTAQNNILNTHLGVVGSISSQIRSLGSEMLIIFSKIRQDIGDWDMTRSSLTTQRIFSLLPCIPPSKKITRFTRLMCTVLGTNSCFLDSCFLRGRASANVTGLPLTALHRRRWLMASIHPCYCTSTGETWGWQRQQSWTSVSVTDSHSLGMEVSSLDGSIKGKMESKLSG